MKLVWLNLFRNKISALLTIIGIIIAIFAFCCLETILWAFGAGVELSDASRLVVRHKESLVFELPLHYANKVRGIKGINEVTYGNWFGGVYEPDEKLFFAQFAVEFEKYLKLYPEFEIDPEQKKALLADKQSCVIGEDLAKRLGKKVGDTLSLRGGIYHANNQENVWKFNVRAIYGSEKKAWDKNMMLFHWDFFNEGRRVEDSKDLVGYLVLQIEDPGQMARISKSIDKLFENSDNRTLTMTEKAFNLEFISMMGNISLLIRIFGTVVVFTILLITINTNMMNARERVGEVGLLKALGFPSSYIFRLYLFESMLLSFIGGGLGIFFSYFLINVLELNPKADFFTIFYLPTKTIGFAVILTGVTGFLSGITPALISSRMGACEALRSV